MRHIHLHCNRIQMGFIIIMAAIDAQHGDGNSLTQRDHKQSYNQYIHYYCLKWDEFEPFNCDQWYSALSYKTSELNMKRNCVSLSLTSRPTAAPTINCDARNSYISAETDQYVYATETLTSIHTKWTWIWRLFWI